MAKAPVNLAELFVQRQAMPDFKLRNEAYEVYEGAFLARSPDKQKQYVTWRPLMMDGGATGDSAADRQWINLCRQIVHHHQASFSRAPFTYSVPYSAAAEADALTKTSFIQGVFRRSRIKTIQPLQAYRLSCRGDAVYGVDWSKTEKDKFISVRAYDPMFCYPDLDKEDMGGMKDMLVSYEVSKDWAENTFNIKTNTGAKKTVRMYLYWTTEGRYVQVEDVPVTDERFCFQHNLGFVPFRWVYNSPNGNMAQSDICEIPKLQSLMSDTLLLAMDAARKRVDKAYWGRGMAGDVVPQAGRVVSFANPQAHIEEFPTADPPAMLGGVMTMLQQFAQGMGGISPISMEGHANGSIVTGTAVRHQVEAIEARTETKRVSIEGGFGILGEYILRVLENQFELDELTVQTDKGEVSMKGLDVKSWYTCEADYGGYHSLGPMERGRWALEGLGRIHDDRKAIQLAYPDEDTEIMVSRVRDYQIRQAKITGESQAAAQQAAMAGQQGGAPGGAPGGGGPPGAPPGGGDQPPGPQMKPQGPPPGMAAAAQAAGGRMVKLSELEALINVVRGRLHGDVWAVGELAVAGQSATPRILVEKKEDQGNVMTALESKGAKVSVGQPNKDEPAVSLLG